ncbi:MAG: nucleotide pyrophosphohydrolase [Candidatus Heimdallarchaeota archaeon]
MTENQDQFETLKEHMAKFLEERDWLTYHSPKNVAMSIAIEAAELMEIFQWTDPTKAVILKDETIYKQIKDELADVMIYSISLALKLDIDLFDCILTKMSKNDKRFPPKTP